jgi:membrane protein DedA with SNARE-associated domain
MNNWITDIMEEFGYIGIFLMIALENLFPPIPSEIVLSFGGFMTIRSDLTIEGVVFAATLGSLAGALLLYAVGQMFTVERLGQWVEKYGRWLRLKREEIEKANRWFHRHGIWAVFLGRMVPIVRSLISIPAGIAKMHLGLFVVFTIVGSLIWNTVLVYVGALLGTQWTKVLSYMALYQELVIMVAIVLAIILVWKWVRR